MLIGCVIVFRDISQEKETDRAKSEFISVASHQLKTPGTIVNLYTEKLLDGRNSELSPKQKEYINEIRSANQSMTDIVSSLLNVSRIEMGIFAVDPVPVDVIEIFKNIAKDSDSNLKDKNINFKQEYHQQEHIIPIDKLLLNIIFSNLLSNAIRYTDKNGTISVKSIIKENNLVISVADNGCGIPAGQQNRIFTKFFRADDARSKYTNGTGLGLYIVKSILDHIGGNVWFTSTENKGSTFYFTIPLVRVTIIK
jgi:two-component system sensor histidine kinase VicK